MQVTGIIVGASDIGGATEPAIGSMFLDAIGCSWDSAYIIGSNKYPGIDLTPRNYAGEYPATYTFAPVDPLPATQGWRFMVSGQAISLLPGSILPDYMGHQTVLAVPAGPGSEPLGAICPLVPARVAGTIELWLTMEGDEGTLAIESAMTGGQQWAIFAAINGGQLSVPNADGTYTPRHSFPTGEWHHLRLDFAGPGQTYLGLGTNQYRLILDQEDLGTFTSTIDLSLDFFVLTVQNVAGTGAGKLYVDAVGFSWDPNYAIGQNLVVSGPPATPVLTLDVGEPGATMTWAPKDVSFETTSYSLNIDGIETYGTWTYGSRISMDLSTLAPGEHLIVATFDDGIGGVTTSSLIVRVVGLEERLFEEIDAIIAAIQSSSDADWRCPATCHKHAMIEKLEEVKTLIAVGQYAEAYDKFLHDIKPKLTGLKTNEDEVAWGNGVEHKPWVTNTALQQSFKDLINPALRGVKTLVDGTPSPPCHGHHGGHHHGDPHHGHGHHCGPHYGNGHHCGSCGHPTSHMGCSHSLLRGR